MVSPATVQVQSVASSLVPAITLEFVGQAAGAILEVPRVPKAQKLSTGQSTHAAKVDPSVAVPAVLPASHNVHVPVFNL